VINALSLIDRDDRIQTYPFVYLHILGLGDHLDSLHRTRRIEGFEPELGATRSEGFNDPKQYQDYIVSQVTYTRSSHEY
jgi:hypothetical protein